MPPNFSNLTMVIKRPTTSYGSVVVLESRASSTDPWLSIFSLDCNTSDDLNKTYLYPANVFQTRGPTMRVWRRKKINKPSLDWYGRWGGNYNGWGLVGSELNPANARFNPWRGQYGGTGTSWGDGAPGATFAWPNQPFTMTTSDAVGAAVGFQKSFPLTVKPQFGVHYAYNEPPTTPGDLTTFVQYDFVSAKGNWQGTGNENSGLLFGPLQDSGRTPSADLYSTGLVACRNINPDGYGVFTDSDKTHAPMSNQDYDYMTYNNNPLLTGMENYCPAGITATRQFRVTNPSTTATINVHFFAAKYTVPSGGATAFFSNVTVNPWGRLEIPMAADFRVEQLMTVQPSTSYPHYTNNALSTQYCPSGLVSDYEGDRRTYAAPAKPSTKGHGGGGGGYATKGANSGAVSGGPARIAGLSNIPVTLVDPQTVITETDAKLLGFIPGQGLEKNVSGSGNNTGQLDAETYIEYISGNEMRLNKSHVSIDNIASTKMHVNALHYDLDRLYDAPFNRTKPWTMLLDSQHLGSPGGDGGDTDTSVSTDNYPARGGSGSGAIRMVVRYMNLSGRIWAIGASGAQGRGTYGGTYQQWSRSNGGGGGGGGSGGTIWLIAQNLSGGYGTSLQGLAPGLSPMCLMDQAYWNFPDLHIEEAGDGSLPIKMVLSSGPVNVSGNISVNGGDGGQSGASGDARDLWRPETWTSPEGTLPLSPFPYFADPGCSGSNNPFTGPGITGTAAALGTEKRFAPNYFFYYKFDNTFKKTVTKSTYTSYRSETNNGVTSWISNGSTEYTSAITLAPEFNLTQYIFDNDSSNETKEGTASGAAWIGKLPSGNTPKAVVDTYFISARNAETTDPIQYDEDGGGRVVISAVVPTLAAGICPENNVSIPLASMASLQLLNGLPLKLYANTPWLNFVEHSWAGNTYQLKAIVQEEAHWGNWDGDKNGQNGGAGSAGRVRVDIGRLDGFNYQGITVTRKAGVINTSPPSPSTAQDAASWDAGETGRTPRDGTIYPSPDLVKWYDPTHNFVYPGNGPLWEV